MLLSLALLGIAIVDTSHINNPVSGTLLCLEDVNVLHDQSFARLTPDVPSATFFRVAAITGKSVETITGMHQRAMCCLSNS